jgi:hypothetical protein
VYLHDALAVLIHIVNQKWHDGRGSWLYTFYCGGQTVFSGEVSHGSFGSPTCMRCIAAEQRHGVVNI